MQGFNGRGDFTRGGEVFTVSATLAAEYGGQTVAHCYAELWIAKDSLDADFADGIVTCGKITSGSDGSVVHSVG